MKKKTHEHYGLYKKRVYKDTDKNWKGKEELALKVAEYYNKFNAKKTPGLY